jgi:hypothetical protein
MAPKIYQVASDPFEDEDYNWNMNILWMDDEENTMGSGSIRIPFRETGDLLKKYFRHNVNPLSNEDLQKIIEESIKGTMQ